LLSGRLEAVLEVVKVAVFPALFEIVKVIPKIVVLVLSRHGAFGTWQAGT